MTLWSGNLRKRIKRPASEGSSDLYLHLKAEVGRLRDQGEMPVKDPGSFSRYSCDLCSGAFPMKELRQCSICGRWACGNCFASEFYVCNSCNGVIKLHQTRK